MFQIINQLKKSKLIHRWWQWMERTCSVGLYTTPLLGSLQIYIEVVKGASMKQLHFRNAAKLPTSLQYLGWTSELDNFAGIPWPASSWTIQSKKASDSWLIPGFRIIIRRKPRLRSNSSRTYIISNGFLLVKSRVMNYSIYYSDIGQYVEPPYRS